MDETPAPTLTFADLMAKVGTFLFCWSWLEQELTKAIKDARRELGQPNSVIQGSLADRLQIWQELIARLPSGAGQSSTAEAVRDQALELREVRNLIVHGLQGGHALPRSGEAFVQCAVGGYENPTGEIIRYSLAEMEHFIQAIDACRRAFIGLGNFNYRLAACA